MQFLPQGSGLRKSVSFQQIELSEMGRYMDVLINRLSFGQRKNQMKN